MSHTKSDTTRSSSSFSWRPIAGNASTVVLMRVLMFSERPHPQVEYEASAPTAGDEKTEIELPKHVRVLEILHSRHRRRPSGVRRPHGPAARAGGSAPSRATRGASREAEPRR